MGECPHAPLAYDIFPTSPVVERCCVSSNPLPRLGRGAICRLRTTQLFVVASLLYTPTSCGTQHYLDIRHDILRFLPDCTQYVVYRGEYLSFLDKNRQKTVPPPTLICIILPICVLKWAHIPTFHPSYSTSLAGTPSYQRLLSAL